ncbi:MAG: hypothetical protein A2Y38_23095 [Spirochaetes bacterium GWB1_59_5]|nr:MAG: hypothetical protein A2Y38_23095 [Spirochaetes bacterium GWB1_59_5]
MSRPILGIGVRAHDFDRGTATTVALRIQAAGFSLAQLAPSKALSCDPVNDDNYSGIAAEIQSSFSAAGVGIAVLGCYINPVDDDEARRGSSLSTFQRHLRMARFLGDPVVGTETGWSDRGDTRSSGTMKTLLQSLASLLEAAEDSGARIAIEGVCRHVVWRPRVMGEVLRSMASPRLAVIYDPVNYIDGTNWREQGRLIEEAFDSFGDRIEIVHAKDFCLTDGLHICPAGSGLLDWPLVLRKLGELHCTRAGPPLPFLLEDTRPTDLPLARHFIETTLSAL